MTTAKLGTLAWVAIYLGMVVTGLGVSLQRGGAGSGWSVTTLGGVGIGVGILLVWLRSRRKDTP